MVACSSVVRSAGLPTSSRRPLVWPNGKSTADILKPTAVVVLKEVPQDAATCLLVGTESNEAHTAVGGADGRFRQHSPDLIGLIIAGAIDVFPDLLLSGMVSRDGKGHELLEGHAIFGIDLVQLPRHRRQPQPLLDDRRRHEMSSRNVFVAQPRITQSLESSELVQRMQPYGFVILRKRVILRDTTLANDAGNWLRLRHALLYE